MDANHNSIMRLEPLDKLNVFGRLPAQTPVQLVDRTEESKLISQWMIKPPHHGVKEDDLNLLFIKNSNMNRELLDLQREAVEESEKQALMDVHRTDKLYHDVAHLKERLITCNLTMQTCNEKKVRADNIVQREMMKQTALKEKSKELRENIDIIADFSDQLASTVRALKPYETIVQTAIRIEPVWTSSEACMQHCDALLLAQEEILGMQDYLIGRMEYIRVNWIKLANTSMVAVLGFNTLLTTLEKEMAGAMIIYHHWEKILSNIKQTLIDQEFEADRLIQGINSIYRLLCLSSGTSPGIGPRIEDRLDFIKEEFDILKGVEKECTAGMNRAHLPAKKKKEWLPAV